MPVIDDSATDSFKGGSGGDGGGDSSNLLGEYERSGDLKHDV